MLAGFASLRRPEDVERSQGALRPQIDAFRREQTKQISGIVKAAGVTAK